MIVVDTGVAFNTNNLPAIALSVNKIKQIMIIPENQVPLDDSENSDSEDQQSQQDIHSNGFDDDYQDDIPDDGLNDADRLQQADKASEAAFTLDLDKGIAPQAPKKGDTNI